MLPESLSRALEHRGPRLGHAHPVSLDTMDFPEDRSDENGPVAETLANYEDIHNEYQSGLKFKVQVSNPLQGVPLLHFTWAKYGPEVARQVVVYFPAMVIGFFSAGVFLGRFLYWLSTKTFLDWPSNLLMPMTMKMHTGYVGILHDGFFGDMELTVVENLILLVI